MEKKPTPFDIASYWVIVVTSFLVPLFFLPLSSDPFEFQKYSLLIGATILLLILWTASALMKKTVEIVIAPFTIPLALFVAAGFASLFFVSQNRILPLLSPSSIGAFTTLFIYFLVVKCISYQQPKLNRDIPLALGLSLGIATMISALFASGLMSRLPLPDYIEATVFSPLGSPFAAFTVLLPILVALASPVLMKLWNEDNKQEIDTDTTEVQVEKDEIRVEQERTERINLSSYWTDEVMDETVDTSKLPWMFISILLSLIVLFGVALTVYQLMTAAKPVLLTPWAAWAIFIDGLKNWKTALLGVGPANYLSAFTQFRPISLNSAADLWTLRFSTSSSFVFTLATEMGLVSLFFFGFFACQIIRSGRDSLKHHKVIHTGVLFGLFTILLLTLIFPINITLLYMLFVFAALYSTSLPTVIVREKSTILPIIIAGLVLLITGSAGYFGYQAYMGEVAFRQSLVAAAKNQAQTAYDKNAEAIRYNQHVDYYHRNFSLLDLNIAQGMAQQTPNDQTRMMISQLIQQSISEAKAAVAANPTNVVNWENLAVTYQRLIGIADGAENWTAQVYQQAVALDPTNPQLRVNYGGVFYSLRQFDPALEQFRIAVGLKGDYANGYYNMAAAFREKGDYQNAQAALQQVMQYTPANNPDFERARKELEDIEKMLPQANGGKEATEGGILNTPATTPAVQVNPPIPLTTESAPPASR